VVFNPAVPRNPGIVFIDLAVALFPVIELAFGDFEPLNQEFRRDFGEALKTGEEIDNLVADIVGSPGFS